MLSAEQRQAIAALKVGDRVVYDNGTDPPIRGAIACFRETEIAVDGDDGIDWRFDPSDLGRGFLKPE